MRKLQRAAVWLLLAAMLLMFAPTALAVAPPQTASASGVRYPVILVPGIAATEIYNRNELVWLNTWRLLGSQLPVISLFQLNWLMPLRLSADCATPYSGGTELRVGDLLRHGLTDVYSGLIGSLKEQGYVEGSDLRLFPYDWRKDPTFAADQLGQLVDRTLRETGAPQVVLIGHSQGGLIARDYVVRGGAPKVKATISLATPFLGAPMAYKALEYGWDLGIKVPGTNWGVMAPDQIKLLAQNYPSVYALSPSARYFDWYPEGYVTRSGRNLSYLESLGQAIAPHNRGLSDRAAAYQQRLLNGKDYGVLQFVVAGSGRSTFAGVAERKDWLGMTQKTERFLDGDEVVPLYSADLGYSKDKSRVAQAIGRVQAVSYVNANHTFFAQSAAVQRVIVDWLASL